MSSHLILDTALPSPIEAELARESSRLFDAVRLEGEAITLALEGVRAKVPLAAARLLLNALGEMGRGHAVTAVALEEEIGIQEAADLLNVSHPFIDKLLDQGDIPSRKAGGHRRMLTRDVFAYRQTSMIARIRALNELVAEGQRLNMGY